MKEKLTPGSTDSLIMDGIQHNISDANQTNDIKFLLADGVEAMRISPEGFWVRGVKVETGPNEAQSVYAAFKEWLGKATT